MGEGEVWLAHGGWYKQIDSERSGVVLGGWSWCLSVCMSVHSRQMALNKSVKKQNNFTDTIIRGDESNESICVHNSKHVAAAFHHKLPRDCYNSRLSAVGINVF